MTLTSVTGYARLHGVTKGAAQKWQARGILEMRGDKVAVEPSDRRAFHAAVGRFRDRDATVAEPVMAEATEVAGALEAAADEAERTAGVDDSDAGDGGATPRNRRRK